MKVPVSLTLPFALLRAARACVGECEQPTSGAVTLAVAEHMAAPWRLAAPSPVRSPCVTVEVEVCEDVFRHADEAAHLSGLTLEMGLVSLLEAFVARDVSPGLEAA